METNITISGQIMAVLSKEYEGKTTTHIQFLMDTEAKGMEILKVKITLNEDMQKLIKGSYVSVPVSMVAVNGNIYYSQVDTIKLLRENK